MMKGYQLNLKQQSQSTQFQAQYAHRANLKSKVQVPLYVKQGLQYSKKQFNKTSRIVPIKAQLGDTLEQQSQSQYNSSQQSLPYRQAPTMGIEGAWSGGATLQKSKQINQQSVKSWEPAIPLEGGGGGDNGNKLKNGGGGGDEGDDDDYFNDKEGDGGDEKYGFLRAVIPMLYDAKAVQAVLEEWALTIQELPSHIKRAVDMSIFSSAHLYRLFALETRPNVAREIARFMPKGMHQGIVGRVMADPAFLQKFLFEGSLVFGTSMWHEHHIRQRKFVKELDLSLINSFTATATTMATVYLLAPTKALNVSADVRFPFQRMFEQLPNNIFERSAPMKTYRLPTRVMGLLNKVGQLGMIGGAGGLTQVGLSKVAEKIRQTKNPEFKYYVNSPELPRAIVGGALFTGLHANFRYQLLGGIDRFMFDQFTYLWAYVGATLATRGAFNWIGHMHRPMFLGMPLEAPRIRKQQKVRFIDLDEEGNQINQSQQTQQVTEPASIPQAVA